ncbi:Subtilase family protein [Amycolatopsis xylanica]|uniref:Subtilase family protein n=1 Tax=Amycolatopsis xylanica TaxID=589385 RepID=A0A1H3JRQ3_9PSEU|nr:S8/S53 family peptidase [Amycolatopsis xylanica]SDY41944.1 Subtilase family protein [Amycolatopsis xylanica]
MSSEEKPRPRRTRLEAQIELILAKLSDPERNRRVGAAPSDWREKDEIEYLYHEEHCLVRDEDLARLQAIVGGEPVDHMMNGVTLLWVEGSDVPEMMREVDARLGVGVATPNHVLSITPVHCCPATEPEVTAACKPDPGVCPGDAGDGIVVSVVDTGLLASAPAEHAWLSGVTGDIENPFGPGNLIQPYAGHGTFIAGVVRCMAPRSTVIVEAGLRNAGAQFESEIVKGLDATLNEMPDVISLSAGGRTRDNLPLLGFEVFYQNRLRHYKGVVLVAAAGNDGDRGPFWPAAFPWAVSVGALSANWRTRASFSDFGGWVDVYAPGEQLVNAYATGTFVCEEPPHAGERREFTGLARWSGTSFSTPLVAGLIAARMSRTGENGRQAADALLAAARAAALPGVGPVLLPCADGEPPAHPHHCCH